MRKRPAWVDRDRKIVTEGGKIERTKLIPKSIPEDAAMTTRHNRSTVANWTLARQRVVLLLHRSGFTSVEIVEAVKELGASITVSQVDSLINRGIPYPKEVEPHKCDECSRVIVTDFCLACELKSQKEPARC